MRFTLGRALGALVAVQLAALGLVQAIRASHDCRLLWCESQDTPADGCSMCAAMRATTWVEAYRLRQGTYPDSLDPLHRAFCGWKAGGVRRLRYRRVGDGYDLKKDGYEFRQDP